MGKMVHARLDDESAATLKDLVRWLDSNESDVIRQALLYLSRSAVRKTSKKIIGLGKFTSGRSDLGSNKDYLDGFGK